MPAEIGLEIGGTGFFSLLVRLGDRLRKTVAVANEQFAGSPVFRFPKRKTISWIDLVTKTPAAIFLGDDGDSR